MHCLATDVRCCIFQPVLVLNDRNHLYYQTSKQYYILLAW